jgi:copper homeostasis protein CutC
MPGGGVTPRNLRRILAAVPSLPEVHMALMKTIDSPMHHRNYHVYMGVPGLPEYVRNVTDGEAVKRVVQTLLGKMD